jgi:GDP-mannose transporter
VQSLLPILGLIFAFNEHKVVLSQPALMDSAFLVVSLLGGIIGFAISFSSLWFLSQTTATIYSLVGALNKIPVAVVRFLTLRD